MTYVWYVLIVIGRVRGRLNKFIKEKEEGWKVEEKWEVW